MAEQHHNFLYVRNSFLKSLDKKHCLKQVAKVIILNLDKYLSLQYKDFYSLHYLKIGH